MLGKSVCFVMRFWIKKCKLCASARHLALLATGDCPCTYCKSVWIRASVKCKCKIMFSQVINIIALKIGKCSSLTPHPSLTLSYS